MSNNNNNKHLKKSTVSQLRLLVHHMEANPGFARGLPKFGASKRSAEEEWTNLAKELNSFGPPTRTISDWKKTWADMKSRTKKKLLDNKRSQQEDVGLLYQRNNLTELEQIIESIFYFSSEEPNSYIEDNAERNESQFGQNPLEDGSEYLMETPLRNETSSIVEENDQQWLQNQQQYTTFKQAYTEKSEDEKASCCSTGKKRKRTLDEQLASVRRQLRLVERGAEEAKASAAERLADAAEVQAEAAKRNADAAESIAASMKSIEDSTQRIEMLLEKYLQNTMSGGTVKLERI